MKLKSFLKKICSVLTLTAMFASGSTAHAEVEYYDNIAGYGYKESRRAPTIAPSVALGAIALAAIIAIALQHSHSSHSH